MKDEMTKKYALKQSLPVMAGYLVLGMGFGMLLKAKGYGAAWAFFMSLFIYAGSMQYVTISLLAGSASVISAALMTWMVNARHLLYGIAMLERYKNTGLYRLYFFCSAFRHYGNADRILRKGCKCHCCTIWNS